jgi:hypothetical protein
MDGLLRRGYQLEIFYFATGEVEFTEEFSRLGIKCRHAFEAAEPITRGYDREDVHGLVKFVRLVDHLAVLAIGSALDRAIKEFRPEIVHCWSDLANVIGGLVSTDLGVPRVVLGQRNLPVFRSIDGMEPYACRDAYRLLIRNLNVVVLNNSLAGLVGYARWLELLSQLPERKACLCVSTVSIVCGRLRQYRQHRLWPFWAPAVLGASH